MLNPSPIKPSPSLTSEEGFGVGGADGLVQLKDLPQLAPQAAGVPAPATAAAAAASPTDLAALAAAADVVSAADTNIDIDIDEPPPLAEAPPMPKLPGKILQLDPISQYRMAQLMASAALAASGHLHVRPQFLERRQPQPQLLPPNNSVPMAFYHHNHHLAAAPAPVPVPLPFSQHPIVQHGSEIWAEMKAQQQKLQEEHERRQRNAAADAMLSDAALGGSEFEMPPLPGQELPPLPGQELPPLPGMEMPPLPGMKMPPLPGMKMGAGQLIRPGQAPLVYHPAASLDQYLGRAPGSSFGGAGLDAVVAAGVGSVGSMVAAGVGGIANGIGGIGAAAAPSAPAGQPKKRGRGRPKGSKNRPKPPGWVKPSLRKKGAKAAAAVKAAKAAITKPSIAKPPATVAKATIPNPVTGGRRCQLQFTATGEEVPFTSKKDGRVALTTNTPREVEAINPVTNLRVHLFNSCSDAARITGINRTKMSRTCRKGGGPLDSSTHGTLLYRYTEAISTLGSDSEDDDMSVGEDEDTAALAAAAAVAAAVANCDATAYAASLQDLKKATGSVE